MPPPSDSTPLLPPFSSSQNSQKSDLTSSSSENTSVPSLTPHYNTVHLLPHFPSPDAYHANPFDPTQAAAPRGSSRGTSIHNPLPSHQSKDHSILRSATSRSLADRSSLLSTSSTLGRSVVLASHDLSLSLRPFEPLSTMPLYSFLLFLLSLPAPSRLILLADLLLSSLHLYSFRACLPSLELFFASVAPSSKTHYLRNVAFMLPPVFLSFMLRFSHFSLVLLLLTNTYVTRAKRA
ncbi:hypothetical protein TeGR_g7370 [Tetraparma gracilis]|uniref:Uncharacterized protein n=1 Tax=Tetraparma gracilis TaxID=2962635 RepID=A0ABQ6M4J4_9STRA|nr:hypothetical protein TeGR_g7370 [Tetraparma gracilis]